MQGWPFQAQVAKALRARAPGDLGSSGLMAAPIRACQLMSTSKYQQVASLLQASIGSHDGVAGSTPCGSPTIWVPSLLLRFGRPLSWGLSSAI